MSSVFLTVTFSTEITKSQEAQKDWTIPFVTFLQVYILSVLLVRSAPSGATTMSVTAMVQIVTMLSKHTVIVHSDVCIKFE